MSARTGGANSQAAGGGGGGGGGFRGGQLLHNDIFKRIGNIKPSTAKPAESPFAAGGIMTGCLDKASVRTGSGESLAAASNYSVSTLGTAVEFVPAVQRAERAQGVANLQAVYSVYAKRTEEPTQGFELRGFNKTNLQAAERGAYVTAKPAAAPAKAASSQPPVRASQSGSLHPPCVSLSASVKQAHRGDRPLSASPDRPTSRAGSTSARPPSGSGGAASGAERRPSRGSAAASGHHPASRVRSFSADFAGGGGGGDDGGGGGEDENY